MKRILLILWAFLIALTVACSDNGQTRTDAAELPGDDTILAQVNGSAITRYDLDQAVQSTLGPQGAKALDEQGRRKMLESLAAARAISQVQDKALSADQAAQLDKTIAAYREQLLVRMYLAQNTPAEPVTARMVEDYYARHPEQFGAKTIRTYEIIRTEGTLTDTERDKLLSALARPAKIKDWSAKTDALRKAGLPVIYSKSASDAKILNPQLRDLMAPLTAGRTSDPTLINGVFYVVRILDEKHIAARPLKDVSAQIRKTLMPVQLKKAVKQASDKVLENATVEYANEDTK
jgi:hypothetical protein